MAEEQESEFSSDKAVVFQNRLQWSVSTKKFPVSIKVIEDNGKMYLLIWGILLRICLINLTSDGYIQLLQEPSKRCI